VVLAEDAVIVVDSLPTNIREFISKSRIPKVTISAHGIDFEGEMELYGNRMIDEALDRAHGNKQAAALLLGLKRTTLVAKLHRRRAAPSLEAGQEWLL
jgi:transcriptional regulator with PAS, ATPase and Fis domain